MLVRFRTQGDMNFAQFKYLIVFNTSGNGQEPLPNGGMNGFPNYSYAFVFAGSGTSILAPQLFQYYANPGSSVQNSRPILYDPTVYHQTFIPPPSSNGTFREFTLIFDRALLNQPLPNQTATPAPSPTPSATATATPTPTGTASASASPSPTPSPSTNTWTMNFFTTDLNGNVLDSLGSGGANDLSYLFQFDISTSFDQNNTPSLTRLPNVNTPFSLSAAIASGELANSP